MNDPLPVQWFVIFLQNVAQNEIDDCLGSPTARLGWRMVCTTSVFAKKTHTKPVGGRGISAFSGSFIFAAVFFVIGLI
ncbi:hypothetical protein [Pseudomonas sp. FSL R10-1339]|uniref:hypothetical protein n=1 Tax=Pseudomonas sp. FSL R10-1339 TaxID=2662196 RepID=UPI0012965997|nr:hypothetical protein [Pseudomonas sp. FSL R10-1339]MQU55052.1 hypothetical protein [Pseudomonas sp. FSL R10-1339]